MRVIAGEFRSRQLLSLPGDNVRPTSDRLRETLFNILGDEVVATVFTDAYAGTGAVGIEALSRGARQVILIEKDRRAIEVIKRNLTLLGIGSRARIVPGPASLHLGQIESGIVFADPPYAKEREYQATLEALECNPPNLLILQHSIRFMPPQEAGRLKISRLLKQGDNALSFYRPDPVPAGPDSARL